jgi:hypothetical protein
MVYYIPHWDDAIESSFGHTKAFILLDACSGYHQILMDIASLKKTAFAGPQGRKYRYKVMPFGLVNAPTIFVIMIYDLKDEWDNEAILNFYITIDENNNCKVSAISKHSITFGQSSLSLADTIYPGSYQNALSSQAKSNLAVTT